MRSLLAVLLLLSPQDEPVSTSALKEHVAFLASPALEGRESGSPGYLKAAEYVAAQFAKLGLKAPAAPPNVVGLLEGSDPKLKDELLVIGANLDGLGRRGDVIFPGADSNASGVAGVIELARALAAARPKRSIAFVAFGGGEQGLVGSAAFAAAPPGKVVAMFNLDMIGRSKAGYLYVGGVGTSPDWKERVARLGAKHALAVEPGRGGTSPTDAVNFYRRGVPVLTFFTNVHEDYRRPTDVAEKVDVEAEAKILRMVLELARETADAAAKPEFRKDDSESVPRDYYERLAGGPAPAKSNRVRLGVNVDAVPQGVKLTSIQEGSAAEAAGLKVGDILTKLGDQKVATQPDVVAALGKFKPGDKTKVTILRAGKELELEVKFAAD